MLLRLVVKDTTDVVTYALHADYTAEDLEVLINEALEGGSPFAVALSTGHKQEILPDLHDSINVIDEGAL